MPPQLRAVTIGYAGLLWTALTALVSAEFAELAERVTPAIVSLRVSNADGVAYSQGTGFFVDADGGLITNYHVIEGAAKVEAISKDGIKRLCTGVLYLDEERDLAYLQFAAKKMPFIKVASGKELKVGSTVVVIGSPKGLSHSLSSGDLAAHRDEDETSYIQITAPISTGSSGSPVMDKDGIARGVATFYRKGGQSLNFAVDALHVARLVAARDTFVTTPLVSSTGQGIAASPAKPDVKPPSESLPERSSPKPPPEESGSEDAQYYFGNIGNLTTSSYLFWEADGTVIGGYSYPIRSDAKKVYSLAGKNAKEGLLLLAEFDSEGNRTAIARLEKELSAGQISWRGTMFNEDGRELPMTLRRHRYRGSAEHIKYFTLAFTSASSSSSPVAESVYYADRVDYLDKGVVSYGHIKEVTDSYQRIATERTIKVIKPPVVEQIGEGRFEAIIGYELGYYSKRDKVLKKKYIENVLTWDATADGNPVIVKLRNVSNRAMELPLPRVIASDKKSGVFMQTEDGEAIVWNNAPRKGDSAAWTGGTNADGYAHGEGTLIWKKNGVLVTSYQGNIAVGKLHGETLSRDANGNTRIRTWNKGKKLR